MNSLKHSLWHALFAVCILCISICGSSEAASPDDGMQAFRSAYFVAPNIDQQFRATATFFGPTFHMDTDLTGEWNANGSAWMGGIINWNDTNVHSGKTTRKTIPLYMEYAADSLSFYGEFPNQWQQEKLMGIPMWIALIMKSTDPKVLAENASAVSSVTLVKETDQQQQMKIVLDGKTLAQLTRNYAAEAPAENQQFAEYLAQGMEQGNLICSWAIDKNTKKTITLSADLTELMRNYAKAMLQGSYDSKLTLSKEEQEFYQAIGYYCNLQFYCSQLGEGASQQIQDAYNLGRAARKSAKSGSILDMMRQEIVTATIH